MSLSTAAITALRSRLNAVQPITPVRLTTTPSPLVPPPMTTLLQPTLIDLEIDAHLATYLKSVAVHPGNHNLRLIGPTGCGKTSIGQWLAQETQRPNIIMDCAVIREPRDWFGYRTIRNGEIQWVDSAFVRMVETPNSIIILDELNRAPSAVLNGLFGLLDHRRECHVEERGKPVLVGHNTLFLATTNIGAKYIGAAPIDSAIRNRFTRVIEMTYLNPAAETRLLSRRVPTLTSHQTQALVEIAGTTRSKASAIDAISTRELLAVAYDLAHFGEQSLRYTLLSKIDDPTHRLALAALLAGKFPSILGTDLCPTLTSSEPF